MKHFDELYTNLDDIVIRKEFTSASSTVSGSSTSGTVIVSSDITIEGYKAVGVLNTYAETSNTTQCVLLASWLSGNSVRVQFRNLSSNSQTLVVVANVLYVRDL